MSQIIAKFNAALQPEVLATAYRQRELNLNHVKRVRDRLLVETDTEQEGGIPLEDPFDVPPAFLASGILNHIPDENKFFVTIYDNGSVGIKQKPSETESEFTGTPNTKIDFDYLANSKNYPLLVDLVGASLKLYSPDLKANVPILPSHFMEREVVKANEAIFNFIASGGVSDERARNFLAVACGMDTSGLRKDDTPANSIEADIEFTGQLASNSRNQTNDGTKIYYGAGREHLEVKDREPLAQIESDYEYGLAIAKLTKRVKAQIELIKKLQDKYRLKEAIHYILVANPMFEGLVNSDIVEIIRGIVHDEKGKLYPNGMFHKLEEPYDKRTNLPEGVVARVGKYFDRVKTSPPIIQRQMKVDYAETQANGNLMFTGDDKNFALLWLWGAIKQLEHRKQTGRDEVYERNGFHFIKGANIHGLLGNTGFDPERMIAGIIELSKFYHAKVEERESNADKHLVKYLEIMLPYTGMSFNGFFSKFDRTMAYPWNLERNHIFNMVVDPTVARTPPWRRSQHEGKSSEKLVNGGAFVHWALNKPDPRFVAESFEKNKHMFET